MNDTNVSFLTNLSSALPSFVGVKPLYTNPKEILSACELSLAEKREILSSWASDARAVPDAPALRRLDNGHIIGIHDVLDALKTLDAVEFETADRRLENLQPRRKRAPSNRWMPAVFGRRHRKDDDDDPPPCPAVIAPLPYLPQFGTGAALEAA